jgi:deoxyribose-phosphate aldolase
LNLNPAPFIDHTLLKPETTADRIRALCEEAVEFGFASVCVPPVFVPLAAALLYGSEVAAGTVVGFPLGYVPSAVKAFEASRAVAAGATELDMVIHLGAALDGCGPEIEDEIRQVVEAAGGAVVKVIIECCCLAPSLMESLVECVVRGGAGYVKTSTGFAAGGATVRDVQLLSRAARGRIGVKAAGGIRDWEGCLAMIEAGASRIGTSAGVKIFEQWRDGKQV